MFERRDEALARPIANPRVVAGGPECDGTVKNGLLGCPKTPARPGHIVTSRYFRVSSARDQDLRVGRPLDGATLNLHAPGSSSPGPKRQRDVNNAAASAKEAALLRFSVICGDGYIRVNIKE